MEVAHPQQRNEYITDPPVSQLLSILFSDTNYLIAVMFSFIPQWVQFAYSSGFWLPRSYLPATYSALAAGRAALATATKCEREARVLFGLYQEDGDNDDDLYGYIRNYGPDQEVFLGTQRRQRAGERERTYAFAERRYVFAEQRKRRKARSRIRRAREVGAFLEDLFHDLGMWTSDSTQEAEEIVSSTSVPDQEPDDLTRDTQNKDGTSGRTSRTLSPARSVPSSSQSHPSSRSASPSTQANTMEAESEPMLSSSPTSEHQTDATTKIQSSYRTRKSLAAISQLESKFEDLKHKFTLPDAVDYISADGEVVTLRVDHAALIQSETRSESAPPAARLAFTPTNVHIRAYDGNLNRILTKLDAVESWGEKKVRDKRRDVVRNVEQEAARIESLWIDVWRRSVGAEKHDEEVDMALVDVPAVDEESTEMTVDAPASVEEVPFSPPKPRVAMPSDEPAEGTSITRIPSTSSLPTEEVTIVPFPADLESTGAPIINSHPTSNLLFPLTPLDIRTNHLPNDMSTRSDINTSISSSNMESDDSDYEIVGLISGSSDEQDQRHLEEEVDFVML